MRFFGSGAFLESDTLEQTAADLRRWTVEQALPLWAAAGFDEANDRFEECLSLTGNRTADVPIRLIVQARQIYSYALAARRNWYPEALSLVERAYRSMVRDFYRPDGRDGWVFSVRRDGSIADGRRDLYSHAFALLAISSYVQATGKREALALVDETLAFIDTRLHAAKSGGYVEELPTTSDRRRQNPHMHLFECMLSLWTNTGEARYLARAGEIFGLFSSRFFRAESGTLGEYFDDVLRPASGAAGDIVEPGHHCEWVWLLRWFERESRRSVQPYADALFPHAENHGYDSAGLMIDEITIAGAHLTPSHRVWPMTEAIKANIAEARLGRAGAAAKAASLGQLLMERFLKPACAGGWIDRLDAEGAPST
ncbi:MAG: AGE family epimerase/isomerase, partial [Proteobacteria bacterium]|nr:AGE family epimerase/isomerase [Pseudomonadota bacterium]